MLGGLLAGTVGVAYLGALHGPFLLDDLGSVVENPSLRHLARAWWPPAGGLPVTGRPLVNLTLAVNYAAGGLHPAGYHLVNLLIHAAAALTLFGLLRRTALGLAGGFAVALLWAVHPLQTESVTYISQRAESLMGLFYLLTLLAFVRERLVASVICCWLGMLCKEVMVSAPLVVLLWDRTFVAGSFRAALRARPRYYGGLAASWLLLGALVISSGARGGTAGFASGVPWWAYALTQLRAIPLYLKLALWPSPLIADYGRFLGGPVWELVIGALALAALLSGTVWLLVRRSPWGVAGAFFFAVLAPSSSVVPVATEIIAEHRMYLPLAAVLAVVVAGGRRVLRNVPGGAKGGLLAALAVAAIAATVARNRVYGSVEAFWTDVALKVPQNAGAHNNLGNVDATNGKHREAMAEFELALRLAPDFSDAHANLGRELLAAGRPDEAAGHLRVALHYRPDEPAWREALGLADYQMANARAERGDLGGAQPLYAEAEGYRPADANIHVNYGGALAESGRLPEAAAELGRALAIEPNAADVHNNLGGILANEGKLAEAKAEFEAALRIQPGYREARDNLDQVSRMLGSGGR